MPVVNDPGCTKLVIKLPSAFFNHNFNDCQFTDVSPPLP
jgi:hypothetical protein